MSNPQEGTRQRATITTADQNTALLRPPERNWRQKIGDFFWDKRKKMCLTRTPVNWLAISFYYSLFVGGVILIFYISMLIAEAAASRDRNRPQYVLGDSWIGSTPSLNFFPTKNDRNLIWLSDKTDYNKYVSIISKEFEKYQRHDGFNMSQFANCSKPPYGYKDKSPCVFFRMNRILTWEPNPYKKGEKLPKEMPKSVKDLIEKSSTPRIWISCDGATAKDRDHLKADLDLKIQGPGGFDISAFPFKKEREEFMDPIVAIQLMHQKSDKILYSFICTLWGHKLDRNVSQVHVVYYFE